MASTVENEADNVDEDDEEDQNDDDQQDFESITKPVQELSSKMAG